MAIGALLETFISCDGEELLGDRYDGNACDLTVADMSADIGGLDDDARQEKMMEVVVSTWRVARRAGWIAAATALDKSEHLCPTCARSVQR